MPSCLVFGAVLSLQPLSAGKQLSLPTALASGHVTHLLPHCCPLLSPSSGDPPSPSSRAPNQPPEPAQREAPWRTVRSIREKNRGNLGTERITEKDGGNVGTQRRRGRRTGGHGEEASYSDKLFHLSQTACGEPQRNGDSSNACAPGQAGRRKYCQCHGTEQTQDRAFLRAPLGFPREGTVRFCGAL